MRKGDIEKSLKRFLKRKVSYSFSLLIAFMITGGISLGAGITAEEIQETKSDLLTKIQTEREEIKRKIAENERLIREYNSDFVELVRKGDFYSKPLFNSTQIFFTYQYLDNGRMKDRTNKEFKETIDAVNKYSEGNTGNRRVVLGNGVVVDNEVFRETIKVGTSINLIYPEIPTITSTIEVTTPVLTLDLKSLPGTITPIIPGIPVIIVPSITVPTPSKEISIAITTPTAIDRILITKPLVSEIKAPSDKKMKITLPIKPEDFIPTVVNIPAKPEVPKVTMPQEFTPPIISYLGGGFDQYANISMPKNNIIIQNYDTYTTDKPVIITTGNTGTTWTGGTITAVTSKNGSSYPTKEGTYYLEPGQTSSRLNAFINELRDHNANIGGEYIMTDNGGGNNTKIFLSHNPAGVGNSEAQYHGIYTPGERRAIFSGKLELHGIKVKNNTNVLVGVDHQLWNRNAHPGSYSVFENRGEIILSSGNNMIGIMIDVEASNRSGNARHKTVNNGKIVIDGKNSIGIDFGSHRNEILLVDVSLGQIQVNGESNYGFRMSNIGKDDFYDKGVSITSSLDINDSPTRINVGGKKNVGVSITKFLSSKANLNPIANISNLNIEITGENVVGFLRTSNYSTNNINDMLLDDKTMGTFSFGPGSKNSILVRSDKYGIQINKNINSILGSTGNIFAQATKAGKIINNATLSSTLENFTGLLSSGSEGASVDNKGIIEITGTGNDNIGIAILDATTGSNSGTVRILGVGNNKSGIYNTGTFNISNGSNIEVSGDSSLGIYNEKVLNISGTVSLKGTSGTTGIYSNGGTIISTSGSELSIMIDDTLTPATKGLAIYADGGATVTLGAAKIRAKETAAGVAAFGAGTNIDLIGSELKYSGDGYAAYSDGTATINLTNANLELSGKATGVELDVLTPKVIMNNTTITMMSNDATVANLKNATGLLSSSLKATIETNLGTGVTIVDGNDGTTTFNKYKIAAVDGGNLIFDINMDKYNQNASDIGYFFSRRFLGQRLELNVNNGVTINATTNSAYATDYFKNQVVGLEMNSSASATSATDAQINLIANSKVIADRTDTGTGAIGLYMNFGKIDVAASAKVEVEKGNNTINNKAVGIYAVNGSTVSNAGDVEVGGNQSIGILGMAYREDSSSLPIVDEFGTGGIFANQGKIAITNTGNITLDGAGTVGIYANNNNSSGVVTDTKVSNIGNITVGNSDDSAAIGIYGKKATISNTGNINVGNGGVAIYAEDGSNITDLGNLKLGSDGIGVMVDGTSNITAINVILTGPGTDISGKTGILYKGTGSENKSIGIAIDASALDKGTAIYAENINITSSGALKIGEEGVGIFVKGTSANTGTNTGTIDLTFGKTGAVGMYTKSANILNDTSGIIEVRDSSQIGMYAEGTNNKALNTGTIKLDVDKATGIYIKSGAVTEIGDGSNIAFSGKSSIGVFAEDATVNFKDNLVFQNNNENKNIYVYGKGATIGIDTGKTVTVDGMGVAVTPGSKTVGLYLENAGTASTFNGTLGELAVINEAVGIYSKGNNNLNVKVTATGDKTTGIFIDGASTIEGTVTARGTTTAGAVGVYGSDGVVTVGAGGLTLNTDTDRGTGMYLTDGASATGGLITVNNTVAGTKNIGVYYSKGTASETVTNGSAISLVGSDSIGIYAADGITLVNNSNITSTAGKSGNIASFVGEGSQLTSTGTITMNDNDSTGMYVEEGKGINTGSVTMNGTASPNKSVVGMVAETKANNKTASIENSGTINTGANLGMYIGGIGTGSGKNTGTITATTGTGVYVDGSTNSFDGTGGTISSNKVGMYLKDTGANKIKASALNIGSGGVGVFSENANIDFAVNVAGTGAVGVVAKGTSAISGNITTGQDSVGVYVLDNSVSFNGANITTGTNSANTSIGVLLNSAVGTYTMSNVTVSAQDGVGIYLDGTTPGINLTHNGTVNTTAGGIGIYVDNGTALTTGTSVLNINGGTGVYVAGGTANLGTGGSLTFNFLSGGGIGVFNNGGTMNLGANITVTGPGSLAATTNGNLISSGNLSVGEGGTGLMGLYDAVGTTGYTLNNSGSITAINGGIGIAAIKGTTNPSFPITINNTGSINASGKTSAGNPTVGIYTDVADIVNTGNINVGPSAIGIYSAHNGVITSVQNDNITMTGKDGIGVYIKGATNGLTTNNITSTAGSSGSTGVVLEETAGNINVGTIDLKSESTGVFVTGVATSTIDGVIKVGDTSDNKTAIGIIAEKGGNLTLAGTTTITAGDKGIGVYAHGAGTIVTVQNTANLAVGTDGVYIYSKDATLNFAGDIIADDQIGIMTEKGTINATGPSTITVKNTGIGMYIKNTAVALGATTIDVQSGKSFEETSLGIYYENVPLIGTTPLITQTGSYTIGMVLNNSTGTTPGGLSIGGSGTVGQVGIMAKENSTLTVAGAVSIDGGDNNIGVYGKNSTIEVNGNLKVLEPTFTDGTMKYSSVGVFMEGGKYSGTGDISLGNESIGIYGVDLNNGTISQIGGTMSVGTHGVGIYGVGTGDINLTMANGITIGDNNSLGVYAKGMNSTVNGDITIGANTSIGIGSEGNGDIDYSGNMTIGSTSIGIYKEMGDGTITTSSGNWTIGNSGYGIFLDQTTGQEATINNNANMSLGMSSVGIFSNGINTVNNSGNITVGATNVNGMHGDTKEHKNSVGMYLSGGTVATSSGTITVNHDHSVGVYGQGTGTKFTNTGTINVDAGGVGILVRDGAEAVNANGANIILGGTFAPTGCDAKTIGMAAYGEGSSIINNGTITVNEGIGMLITSGATFENAGTINVVNGIGIEGAGALTNTGTINVTGSGTDVGSSGLAEANVGVVTIKPDGTILINDQYTSIGGTLTAAGDVIVDGAHVDVTTGTPLSNANSVSGEVRLLPNFATTGNGITYEIEDFVNTAAGTITGTTLTPITSPLFVAKVTTDGNLVIAKRPYADLTIGEQFDALDQGLDNILKNSGGYGRDADILMGLNEYLEGLPENNFAREAELKLAETRGDIYATIQGRMQDINRAFDNSFYELESSYNLTKDSSKYSVIYTDGDYRDSTIGIDDYDYKVMGLLYMKEKEGTEYGSKYGYTLGFAGSKFDFDDGGSKEDVYSLRVGAHRVKNLSEEHKVSWLSRLELGYNRHIAKRKLNLQETFENKGEYNTYSVALDNRLTKVIYTDLSRQLDIYADLDLEYGKVDDFKESAGSKGGLEVQIKDNDYLSAQIGAGVKASQRIYAGNDISVKVTADVKYAYELGDNYDGNKARLKNGDEGYYSLITPEEREGKLTGKIGLTVEKANHMGVTFEVEAADEGHKKDSSIKYGVRFNYKF